MTDLYAVIAGLVPHAYEVAAIIFLLALPARILSNALHGRLDLR